MFENFVQEAVAGNLKVEASVAIDARLATEEWLVVLNDMYNASVGLPKSGGFSTLDSAKQLAEKFDKLASEPETGTGLQQRLRQFIDSGEELRDLFDKIAEFQEVDRVAALEIEGQSLPR